MSFENTKSIVEGFLKKHEKSESQEKPRVIKKIYIPETDGHTVIEDFKKEFEYLLSKGDIQTNVKIAQAILDTKTRRPSMAKQPVDACKELAELIDGNFERIDPNDETSTPIVTKEINNNVYSIVYYRSTSTYTIYDHSLFLLGFPKKLITTRSTPHGISMALENIKSSTK